MRWLCGRRGSLAFGGPGMGASFSADPANGRGLRVEPFLLGSETGFGAARHDGEGTASPVRHEMFRSQVFAAFSAASCVPRHVMSAQFGKDGFMLRIPSVDVPWQPRLATPALRRGRPVCAGSRSCAGAVAAVRARFLLHPKVPCRLPIICIFATCMMSDAARSNRWLSRIPRLLLAQQN
jgi:hypothetical protein